MDAEMLLLIGCDTPEREGLSLPTALLERLSRTEPSPRRELSRKQAQPKKGTKKKEPSPRRELGHKQAQPKKGTRHNGAQPKKGTGPPGVIGSPPLAARPA